MKATRQLVSQMSSLSSRSMRLLQQRSFSSSKLLLLSSSHHSYTSSSTTTIYTLEASLKHRIIPICRQQQRNYVASSASGISIQHQQQRTASTVAIPNENMMEMIKELRNRTGAPIVDCKKAYNEAQKVIQEQQQQKEADESLDKTNDIYTIAIDWLRRHTAIKTTNKVAGRTTNEGLIGLQITSSPSSTGTATSSTAAAMVKVVSETDFAALSTNFLQFVQTVVTTTLQNNPPSVDALLLLQSQAQEGTESDHSNSKTMTIQDSLNDTIVSIRENISIADIQYMSSSTSEAAQVGGIISGYVHNNSSTIADISCGTAAAVVLLAPTSSSTSTKVLSNEEIQMIGKQLAMHIVAAKPLYQSIEDIPSEVVEAERSILIEQIQKEMESKNTTGSKKPNPTMMEKILMGKLQKFYSTICLMEQHHMIVDHNGKAITVKDYLQQQNLTLKRYIHMFI